MYLSAALLTILALVGTARADSVACSANRPRDLTGLQGTFQSPNYPNNYPNNAICHWRITADESEATVRVEFDEFDTEARYDEVSFYDGSSTSAPLIRTESGGRPNATESTGNSIYVAFTTDSSVTATGFAGKFTTEKACSRNAPREIEAGSPGSVTSPYFPSNYGGGMRCNWTLTADSDQTLALNFEAFDVEDSEEEGCRWDYLEVYDGDTLVGRYCGGYEPPSDITTTTNEVKLFFRSDLAIELTGFKINYEPVGGSGGNPTTPGPTPTPTGPTTAGTPGTTTAGTPGTTNAGTPGTTTPGPTLPPVPQPEGLFLELQLTQDISSADGSDMTPECVSLYGTGLRLSLADALVRMNAALGDSLCAGVNDLELVTGNTAVTSSGQSGKVFVAAYLSASSSRTFLAHHDCGREISNFMADISNWVDPIIPSIPGCPDVEFASEEFNPAGAGWAC